MELVKKHWTKQDIIEFEAFLKSFSKGKEKSEWEQRIINTSLPCIAVPSQTVKKITKEIAKGNFLEFLSFWPWNNFTETSIVGGLLMKIEDKSLFEKYLSHYSSLCDNWATCDGLKFPIQDKNKDYYFSLSKLYIKKEKPFEKRIGLSILLKFVDDEKRIDEIFEILNSFEKETEYYVNMMISWIVCDCFIKQRSKTINFLKSNKLSSFVQNKAISKCHDSFRVSTADKEYLKTLRK